MNDEGQPTKSYPSAACNRKKAVTTEALQYSRGRTGWGEELSGYFGVTSPS